MVARILADDHGNQTHAAALSRCGETEARLVGEARFSPVAAFIETHEAVGIGNLRISSLRMLEFIHPNLAEREIFLMRNELCKHFRHVVSAGILRFLGKSGAVGKQGIFRAQLLRAGIHFICKQALAARYTFRHRNAAVVCGTDDDAFDQLARGILGVRLQKYLRAAHGSRTVTDRNHLVQRKVAAVDRIEA